MSSSVVTVDTVGFVRGASEKADRLFAYFLATEKSQTDMHQSSTHSFPQLLQEWANDRTGFRVALSRALQEHLLQGFDLAEVDVSLVPIKDPTTGVETGKLDVEIRAVVTENGIRHSLGRLIQTSNQTIMAITPIH